MAFQIRIDRLAAHYIDSKNQKITLAKGEINFAKLAPTVQVFLEKLINDVLTSPESADTHSADFTEEKPFFIKQKIEKIIDDADSLYPISAELAQSLYTVTTRTASTGLLGVFRLIDLDTNKVRVAIIKIRDKDQSFVKLREEDLTQITVEDIENMLVDEIQKAAVSPHPNRNDFQLKIIDKQRVEDPATYFGDKFLGATTKKSDDHQVKKLLPVIRDYAKINNQKLENKELPGLIEVLKKDKVDITTSHLAMAVRDKGIFGKDFNIDKFVDYINKQSEVGPLKIPSFAFAQRKSGPRKITVTFKTLEFRGITIKGPAETIQRLLEHEGNNTVFRIEAPSDAIVYDYD